MRYCTRWKYRVFDKKHTNLGVNLNVKLNLNYFISIKVEMCIKEDMISPTMHSLYALHVHMQKEGI
jgi:hypothetical protein